MADDERAVLQALREMAIVSADNPVRLTPLDGGVSSAIYRADLPSGVVCVKRALSRLKVAAEWTAPVVRNRYEAEWMRVAGAIVPEAVPKLLGEAPTLGAFAMEWLPPAEYPVWKQRLRDGLGDAEDAGAVGNVLGRIHAATAGRADIAARFPTTAIFEAIRIEPYLLATAVAHPPLATRLHELAATARSTRRALVHGDFSPKNILIGPRGPVVVDAECAWYGDPAFDLAFVLNHLLLKAAWQPGHADLYSVSFHALVSTYRRQVDWEPWGILDSRAAALLPGLMLARVDGKSPVEYLVDEPVREQVRAFAIRHLVAPAPALASLATAWFGAVR